MRPINVVKVTITDAEQLQSISIATFTEAFAAENTEANMSHYVNTSFSLNTLKNELQNHESAFYFALLENKTVGYFKINEGSAQTDIKTPDAIEIERIYVLKEFYGKGVGQLLFDTAINLAKQKNCKYVWLGVWDGNPRAVRFYEKNGFEAFSSHKFWLGDDEQTDILMRLNL